MIFLTFQSQKNALVRTVSVDYKIRGTFFIQDFRYFQNISEKYTIKFESSDETYCQRPLLSTLLGYYIFPLFIAASTRAKILKINIVKNCDYFYPPKHFLTTLNIRKLHLTKTLKLAILKEQLFYNLQKKGKIERKYSRTLHIYCLVFLN